MHLRAQGEAGPVWAWLRPVLIGLTLTPVAGFVGFVVMMLAAMLDLDRMEVVWSGFLVFLEPAIVAFGVFIGSALAFPITAVLLPVLFGLRMPGPWFGPAGALGGAAVCAPSGIAAIILGGLLAGLASGLVFGRWAARRREAGASRA